MAGSKEKLRVILTRKHTRESSTALKMHSSSEGRVFFHEIENAGIQKTMQTANSMMAIGHLKLVTICCKKYFII